MSQICTIVQICQTYNQQSLIFSIDSLLIYLMTLKYSFKLIGNLINALIKTNTITLYIHWSSFVVLDCFFSFTNVALCLQIYPS